MAETLMTRLHIGGLTPLITPDHLRDRFRSFGTVLDVETLGPDALGQPRPFAYLTLETSPQQLRKCLNIMSGAMWRGTQLRLAEARPTWQARLEKDRKPPAEAEARRAHKRLRRLEATMNGKHAQDMRPVTASTAARQSQFWINDDGHLIRPLALRPAHPLPTAVTFSIKTEKVDKAGKPKMARAPTRAPRRVIDPLRWAPSHGLLTGAAESPAGDWVFVDADSELEDEGADEEGRTLLGHWTDGEQRIPVRGRRTAEEDELSADEDDDSDADSEMELFPARADSPLFPGREASPLFPAREASPLFHARKREVSPLFPAREASPLFPARENAAESKSGSDESGSATDSDDSAADAAASSPLFPAREVPGEKPDEEEEEEEEESESDESSADEPAESVESFAESSTRSPTPAPAPRLVSTSLPAVPAQVRVAAATERKGTLGVLAGLLGGDAAVSAAEKRGAAEWAGFGEDSDDDGDYSALKPQAVADDDEFEVEVARKGRKVSEAREAEMPLMSAPEAEKQEPLVPLEDEEMESKSGSQSDSSDSGSSSSGSSSSGSSNGKAEEASGSAQDADAKSESGSSTSDDSGSSSDSSSGSDSGSDSNSSDSSDSSDSGSDSSDSSDGEDEDKKDDKKPTEETKEDEELAEAKDEEEDPGSSSDSSDSSSGSDSDSSDSDSDDSDSDSDSSDSDSDSDSDSSNTPAAPTTTTTATETLKDMFATSAPKSLFALADGDDTPAPSGGGFSLGTLAPDLEIDEDMDIALPNKPAPQLEFLAPTTRSNWSADAGVPLFFPLVQRAARRGEARSVLEPEIKEDGEGEGEGEEDEEGQGQYGQQQYGQRQQGHSSNHGPHPDRADRFASSTGANLVPVAARKRDGFWRDATDAEMRTRWEARRLELTRGWKRKHREAVKHRRRRGGDDAE